MFPFNGCAVFSTYFLFYVYLLLFIFYVLSQQRQDVVVDGL